MSLAILAVLATLLSAAIWHEFKTKSAAPRGARKRKR